MTNYLKLVSIEIGNVADNVVSATFSNQIVSFDFSAGITIKVNGSIVQILSVKRLNDQRTFQYTISQSVISTDTVTFSYLALPSTLAGIDKSNKYGDYISSEFGVVFLDDVGELTVVNNVPEGDPIGDALRAINVLYYKFDEANGDLIDSSGNGNTLNIFSGTINMVSGKINNGLNVNSLHAQAGRAVTNGVTIYPGNYTISFWINFTEINTDAGEHPIFGKSGPDESDWEFGAYVQKIGLLPTTAQIFLYTFSNSTSTGSGEENALLENIWYYVIFERDNNGGNLNGYVNGVLKISQPLVDGDVNILNAPFYFGDIKSSVGTEKFVIDEFGIYTNMLTQEQKDYLYNNGDGRTLYP